MEKKILFLAGVLVLALTLIVSVVVLAGYQATQQASTSKATTIAIKNQDGTQDVATITFPEGTPGSEVTAPYNDKDGSGSPQVFSDTASTPVVRLVTDTTYNLWWKVTDTSGWDTAVSNENCYITDSTAVAKATFDTNKATLSTWGTETNTTQQVTTAKKYFYLTINLENVGGKTGTSTLAVLGETP
jgi:hypothetical protein